MAGDECSSNSAGVRSKGKAVVLLSGGLDSATCLAIAHAEGWDCRALTIRYGQRHGIEVERARALAAAFNLREHRVVDLDLAGWGGSSLTGDGPIPGAGEAHGTAAAAAPGSPGRPEITVAQAPGSPGRPEIALNTPAPGTGQIPTTYVPARNTVLLSLALAWAEVLRARAIFLGVSAVDYSGYPDCRPAFVDAFQSLAQVATKAGLEGNAPEIRTPLLNKSKAETIRWGAALGLDYGLTWSCYDPGEGSRPCGRCDSCRLRAKGFAEAGIEDPVARRK